MTSPTVVLVHGALADASSWSGVIAELQAADVNVTAGRSLRPPNHAIHPDAERDMARRAGAEVVELDASHAVAVSQPERVTEVILQAVQGASPA